MNVVKRFASSSTATASSLSQFVPVSAPYLPPVLERHVQRHLSISPESTSIPNPFAGPTRSISRRREKQLRSSLYHDILPLPPTTASASTSDTAGAGKVKILFDGGEKELDWAPAALSFKQQQKATAIQQQGADVKYATGIHKGKTELKFKGHKHEREKPERERETRERLEGMDKRIGEWRKTTTTGETQIRNIREPGRTFAAMSTNKLLEQRHPELLNILTIYLRRQIWILHDLVLAIDLAVLVVG